MPFLEINDLHLYYGTPVGEVLAVKGVSFKIEHPGEALGIVGESGSGKTSLGSAIMRLLPKNVSKYQGSIKLEDRNLMDLHDEDFRRQIRWKNIAMVTQGSMNALNPVLRIETQITERLLLEQGVTKKEARRSAEEMVEMVGLAREILQRYPHELSGGMKQRVVIALALVMSPKLIILDEPTSALDVSVQAQVMNLLKDLKRTKNLTMIFITHDIALATDLCDRIIVAYGGEHIESGSIVDVLLAPKHPYTEKLISSIPRLHQTTKLEFLTGTPPDLVDPIKGCPFSPRCPQSFAPCETAPPDIQVKQGHLVRCWLHEHTS